ncbi:MAG: Hsp20/alpha crystallin family protein [Caldilineaceae bacterium]|nr:Hsp20/alpha crystallin family protein [Caldilineaceae bacterium]
MRIRTYGNVAPNFAEFANAMNEIVGRGLPAYNYAKSGGSAAENGERLVRLPIDLVASDEGFHLYANLPGVKAEDVEITLEGEELTIRGAFPPVAEETNFVKRELYHGSFERRLVFNTPVDVEKIEAVFENGVLTLFVPKAEEVRPKQIKIQAK